MRNQLGSVWYKRAGMTFIPILVFLAGHTFSSPRLGLLFGRRIRMRRNGNSGTPNPVPDYLAILEQARQSPNCFKTREEGDRYIADLRNER